MDARRYGRDPLGLAIGLAVAFLVAPIAVLVTTSGGLGWLPLLLWLAFCLWSVWTWIRRTTVLDDGGITIAYAFRRSRVAWSELTDVVVLYGPGARGWRLRLWCDDRYADTSSIGTHATLWPAGERWRTADRMDPLAYRTPPHWAPAPVRELYDAVTARIPLRAARFPGDPRATRHPE